MKVVVIQGPNLNMLGVREQNIYGPMKLEQIHAQMKEFGESNGLEVEFFQSIHFHQGVILNKFCSL